MVCIVFDIIVLTLHTSQIAREAAQNKFEFAVLAAGGIINADHGLARIFSTMAADGVRPNDSAYSGLYILTSESSS